MNSNQPFAGVQWVPGLGYVSSNSGASGLAGTSQLGDDASVMMISGVGSDARNVQVNQETGVVEKVTGAGFRLGVALKQPVVIGNITLPLWAWLLIAAGAMGLAGYFFLFKKK